MSNKNYKIAEDIIFSAAIFKLSKGERDIKLSNKEAELLEMLCDEAGSVIARGKLQVNRPGFSRHSVAEK